jgi:TolB protein
VSFKVMNMNTLIRRWSVWVLTGLLLALPMVSQAELNIVISGGQESGVPIAVVPFATTTPTDFSSIIRADLARSGQFAPLAVEQMPSQPSMPSQVQFDQWRAGKAQYLVVGKVEQQGNAYQATFYLLNVTNGQQMAGRVISAPMSAERSIAHRIADIIFKQITGIPGAFDTKIAYVTETDGPLKKRRYTLEVADSDGANPQTVLNSAFPLMSPTWSPDGTKLAYVSFEGNRSGIWVQDLRTGQRYQLTKFPGINGAPSWSPKGNKIALTLSKYRSPNIYVVDMDTRNLTQMTNDGSINTEAAWLPDNQTLIFTSDRSGSPQIFEQQVGSHSAQRLTFGVPYAAGGAVSPDGKTLAMIAGGNGGFRIAVQSLTGGGSDLRYISQGGAEERPSFAPNGTMLIYASQSGGDSVLKVSPIAGQGSQTLRFAQGKVRDPAWGPFLDNSQ